MKNRSISIALLWSLLIHANIISAAETRFLRDDFEDGLIDQSVWTIMRPFYRSAAVETGGALRMTSRGGLLANSEFDFPIEITGSIRINSDSKIVRVVTRSRGTQTNTSGEYDDGYAFTLSNHDTSYVRASIERIVPPTVITIQKQAATRLVEGQYYNFRITDDGTNMFFYVGNMETPLLTYSTTETFGSRIGFYNRENGSQSDMGWIQISSLLTSPTIRAKYSGHFVGIATPSKFTTNCNERAVVSLTIDPAGNASASVYDYNSQLITSASGTVDKSGKLSLTLDGLPIFGRVTSSGVASLRAPFNGCKYSVTAYRRFKGAHDPNVAQ